MIDKVISVLAMFRSIKEASPPDARVVMRAADALKIMAMVRPRIAGD